MKEQIDQLCKKYNLGSLQDEPFMVPGGLLHKMYHVVTDQGQYAVKVLNPDIMQRKEALQNMINSELVSHQLKDVVPLVAARSFQGKYVLEEAGQFFMIFDWLEGNSVFVPEISEDHCQQIGRILGKIHTADVQIESIEKEQNSREAYDWDFYIKEAEKQGDKEQEAREKEYFLLLKRELSHIIQWDQQVVKNQQEALKFQVISHRDLDPKNVMWKDKRPYIIDWEAAGYVNPYQELIEVFNYWIADQDGGYNYKKFQAVMQAYTESMNISEVNWDVVLKCSFDGMLGWLEYNVKRALGLEGSCEDDMLEGQQQVVGTIGELKRYEAQTELLKTWIEEFVKGKI